MCEWPLDLSSPVLVVGATQDDECFLDVKVVFAESGAEVRANRTMLGTIPYFDFILSQVANSELQLVDNTLSPDAATAMIDFVHGQRVLVLDLDHFLVLVAACHAAQFSMMTSCLEDLLKNNFGAPEILCLLNKPLLPTLREYCVEYAAKHFHRLSRTYGEALLSMSSDTITSILKSKNLDILDELEVWKWIKQWTLRRRCRNDDILSAVYWHLIPEKYFYSQVATEPLIAVKAFKRSPTWRQAKLCHTLSTKRLSNKACRNPNYCVLAFHNQLSAHYVKKVEVLRLDSYGNRFVKLMAHHFPSAMRVHSALQSPINPSEVILLIKSWQESHAFAAYSLNFVTAQCIPLPSFPDRGEKLLCAAKDQLIAVTKLPVPALHVLDWQKRSWENINLPEAMVSWFGVTAVTIPGETFYLIGAMRVDNLDEGEASLIHVFDPKTNSLRREATLNRHRSSPVCCLWGDKIVIAGGIWHELQGAISIDTYCTLTRKMEELPDIPIHLGFNFDICQYRAGLLAMAGYAFFHRYRIFFFDPERQTWEPMYYIFQEKKLRISTILACKVQGIEEAQNQHESAPQTYYHPGEGKHRPFRKKRGRPSSMRKSILQVKRENADSLPPTYLGLFSILTYCFLLFHGFK
jgi:hypothetical protein